jgi:hypothetical protein
MRTTSTGSTVHSYGGSKPSYQSQPGTYGQEQRPHMANRLHICRVLLRKEVDSEEIVQKAIHQVTAPSISTLLLYSSPYDRRSCNEVVLALPTSDPVNAQRARRPLTGSLAAGCRVINPAQRKTVTGPGTQNSEAQSWRWRLSLGNPGWWRFAFWRL